MKPFFFILVVFLGIIFISLNVEVNAVVITVSTTEDNTAGSLREAISTANANGEDNVIYLLAGTAVVFTPAVRLKSATASLPPIEAVTVEGRLHFMGLPAVTEAECT